MTSEAAICNVGLTLLKRGRITSLTDGTPSGNDCNAIFVPLRQSLIRSHDWNFTRKRQLLARTTTTPVSEFDYEYQLPTGWLRTITVADNDNAIPGVPHKHDADKILSSAENIYLVFSQDITDVAKMPPDFRLLFSYEIAVFLAETNTDRDRAQLLRNTAFNRARASDSIEDLAPVRPAGKWITRRWGRSSTIRA